MDDQLPEDLWELYQADIDGRLTPEQSRALEERILSDEKALRDYLECVEFHAQLYLWTRETMAYPNCESVIAKARENADNRQRSNREGTIPTLVSVVAQRAQSVFHEVTRHPRGLAVSVAGLVIIGLLTVMAITPVREWIAGRNANDPVELPIIERDFVARITNRRQPVWTPGEKPLPSNAKLKAGRRLALQSGLIEITFLSGARVVVEGPAEFTLEGENLGTLHTGQLAARVPKEALGFTVDVPGARIVDRGTEFGANVDDAGTTKIVVVQGAVDVTAGAEVRTLRTGQGVAVDGDGRFDPAFDVREEIAAANLRLTDGSTPDLETTPDAFLVAHYKFDEAAGATTAINSGTTGAVDNGTLTGGVTSGVPGVLGKAYSFDGSTGYVDIGDPSFIGRTAGGTWTISYWLKTTNSDDTEVQVFIGNAGNDTDYFAVATLAEGTVRGLTRTMNTITDKVESGSAINDGRWRHIAVTFDFPASKMQLFVNGRLVDTRVNPLDVATGINSFEIGRLGRRDIDNFVDGSIDDVRIYRTVLSATDIEGLYQAAAP